MRGFSWFDRDLQRLDRDLRQVGKRMARSRRIAEERGWGTVPIVDYGRYLATDADLRCTQSATDLLHDQPRCGWPAIAIVHTGGDYAVCGPHMRRLYEVGILRKTDTGSLAARDPDGIWRRVGQTWYMDHLDE